MMCVVIWSRRNVGGRGKLGQMGPSIFFYLRIVFAYCFGDGQIKIIGVSAEEGDVCIFRTGSNPASPF